MFPRQLVQRRAISSLKNSELFRTRGLVNGEWINSSTGHSFEVFNPALATSSQPVATVQSMTKDDYENAVQVANEAFHAFKHTTPEYRSEILLKLYHLINENSEDLARLIVLENGKSWTEALGEVKYAASFFKWFAQIASTRTDTIINSAIPGRKILALKQPVGVCGILTPWNFPIAMITRKVGAYLAAGCTGVVKPASETPLSALAVGYLAQLAGVPKGVINVLPSEDAAVVGKFLCKHPVVKKISFTGSTNVGKLLMEQSSSTLKKLSFELGGNAPLIVFDDADIDRAVEGAFAGKFRGSGQTCICVNRLYVHEKIYDEFADKLKAKIESSVVLGNGLEEGVTHGPIIHDRSFAKVRHHIEDAVSKGAKVLTGGNARADLGPLFHELTLLGDVNSSMLIAQEETFGPVCPLIKFSSEEDVIAAANDVEVGLAGYFYSENASRIFRVAESIDVGMVGVNTTAISEAAVPFGGVKHSGFGREGSVYGIDDYLNIKAVVVDP